MKPWRFLLLALLAVISLASCEKENVASPTAALLENRWLLARIDDAPVAVAGYSGASKPYLEFVDLGKCTVGLGPCNNFSGRFRLGGNGQLLSISPQIPTRVACPVQTLETRFLDNLALTTRYEISGEELRLYDATAATPRLVFRRAGK
ncbi:META domain-containing protein [Hymenobacter terricola]|uniref:META domain-containing protein n=1 Tax=Hymenobacter terricola TaxID=2819236 RepID=UPI001B3168A7|nr:META domain-containing protein [Hymenobacter terricola]